MGVRTERTAWVVLLAGIGLVALGVRLGLLWRTGPLAIGTYDDGVHYAAAVNLVHGRLPYRDVLLLQPPGIVLAASPFAALAPVVGDPAAFVLAKLALVLVGAVNAVVAALVLRRFGLVAVLVGGALHAVSFAIAYDERTLTLEPIGTLGVLVALLLLPRARRLGGRWAVLAGAAAGIAVGCKVWYVVALLVLVAAARGRRLPVLVGGAAAAAAVYLPFFVAAPQAMWEQVVLAQLGRAGLGSPGTAFRLRSVLGLAGLGGDPALPGAHRTALLVAVAALAAAVLVVALRDARARVFAVLAIADAVVVLAAPSYFQHYAVLVASPLALAAGAASGIVLGRVPVPAVRAAVTAALVAAVVVLNAGHDGARVGSTPPLAALRTAAERVHGCVVSDDPALLAAMDVLTRAVASGCRIEADPAGISYAGARYTVDGRPVGRARNPVYQREVTAYLLSGAAHVVVRLRLDHEHTAALDRGTTLAEAGRYRLVAG